jgi:hydrogenase maturation protein HypF
MDKRKGKRVTKKIKVYGIVQGVGFRPLVYRIAKKLGINGTVRNVGGYVEIIAQAEEEKINTLLSELQHGKIGGAEVVKLEAEEFVPVNYETEVHKKTEEQEKTEEYKKTVIYKKTEEQHRMLTTADYEDFTILGSMDNEAVSIIPPDLPVCPDCQRELYNTRDRRYQNPFISCMTCGPRYTILEELPYDRHTTTMKDFEMCPECSKEYSSPSNRRFHAQTISCNDCGPYLIYRETLSSRNEKKAKNSVKANKKDYVNIIGLEETADVEYYEQEAFNAAVSVLRNGGIIAVKGIGGYHLVCSPMMEDTVENLRKLKGREEKPFAVMFSGLDQIKDYCLVSGEEQALLETKARPIVLLYMPRDAMAPSTNKGSIYCGAFLPYTPLQLLLTGECGPLIMTSANLSDRPIIRADEVILSLESPYLDGVLYNRRRIVRSVDDSVAKVIDGKPQLIRRSRGYVPYPVFLEHKSVVEETTPTLEQRQIEENGVQKSSHGQDKTIFAAGGDLKAAFCLYQNGNAVVSQYFGDLEENSVMDEYQKSYQDLTRLLKMTPSLTVCDLHPNYFSSEFAKHLKLPFLMVQHHHAHVASVMAEHDLKGKVIGVSFDGTGYGTDGNIWGGEFLICEGAEFIRAGQLRYTPMLGGDESMRDAQKTAACFLLHDGLEQYVTDSRKAIIKAALEHKINTVLTSSMGRLFDAVSSILEIRHRNRYEGECAATLEREAVLALRENKKPAKLSFAIATKHEIIEINPRPVLETLCRLKETEDTGVLALGFHFALAEAVSEVCERLRNQYGSNTVALSGGVFQNTALTEQTLKLLRNRGFQTAMNLAVPPNDGGISLGQAYIGLHKEV